MPIQTVTVTADEARKILALQEGHFLDMKSIDIAPSKLTRALSAFANADGGELYIGIDEDKTAHTFDWRGFKKVEEANSHVQVFEQLFPLGQHVSVEFLGCQSRPGYVMHVEIKKTPDIKYASDKVPYLRRGAQSLSVDTDDKLTRLRLNKGITTFESETVSVDSKEIAESTVLREFMKTVVPSAEPAAWLRKQQLIKESKPTVAGVVLFADEPQAMLPKRCSIKIYRYKTKDAVGSREALDFTPITVDGCAYDQIKSAVAKAVSIIESIQIITAIGFEKVQYPVETIHEIVTNAVLHRDYSIADDVHVRIFDNRVEVESPGTLPAHITEENILDERFARNGTIVRLINKFPDPPNKDVGEGLNTAFSAMRKLKLKEPVIKQKQNSVIVYIKHEPLATPEEIVMKYLDTNGEINNSKGREICYVASDTSMKTVFNRLIRAGLIEPIPGRKTSTSAYRKKPKDH
jgi:ATP-dependent DNA helicase RecG